MPMVTFDNTGGERTSGTRPATKDSVAGPDDATQAGEAEGRLAEGLFHQRPGAASQVAFPYEDAAPTQGCQEPLGTGLVGPEFREVGPGFDGPLFEGREEPVGMSPVTLLGQYYYIDQVGDSAPEPEPQASNPIPDLIAEDEVALVERAGPARQDPLPARGSRRTRPRSPRPVPCRESSARSSLPPPSPMGDSHPSISNTNAKSAVPVCEGHHTWAGHTPQPDARRLTFGLDFCEAKLEF